MPSNECLSLSSYLVAFVEQDDVRELNLVGEQIDDVAFVVFAEPHLSIDQIVYDEQKSRWKLAASTSVTIVSSFATSERLRPDSSAKVNVSATGIGSLIPVDSISR